MVRCLWAWAFALDPTLLDLHPRVAAAVREGVEVVPPTDHRVVVAATTSLSFWCTHGRDVLRLESSLQGDGWRQRQSRLWLPGPDITSALPVVVAAPPFLVILVDEEDVIDFPYFDPSAWLTEPAGQRRPTTISLPVVEVVNERLGHPVTHRDITAHPRLDSKGE